MKKNKKNSIKIIEQENHLSKVEEIEIINKEEEVLNCFDICKELKITDLHYVFVIRKYKDKSFSLTHWKHILISDKIDFC